MLEDVYYSTILSYKFMQNILKGRSVIGDVHKGLWEALKRFQIQKILGSSVFDWSYYSVQGGTKG